MQIDTHQHFLNYYEDAQHYDWISDEHRILKRNFFPGDLLPELGKAGVDVTIAIQARQNLQETQWLLDLAIKYPWIVGVIGWVDLRAKKINQQLKKFAAYKKFKGVRHVIHDEPDDKFILREDFQYGISLLQSYNLTYDLLVFPRHLAASKQLVKKFPEQRFVIDHIAKPSIKTGELSNWQADIEAIAKYKNVYCKLSGMVTEADKQHWQAKDFTPYLDILFSAFGKDRLMYGSDWPVCLLAASYQQQYNLLYNYLQQFSPSIQAKVWGENAIKFYRL